MDIKINASTVSFTATSLTYKIDELYPNKTCKIIAYLVESNGNRIKRYDLQMHEHEYSEWGTDDNYLIDWICEKCGVSRVVENEPILDTVDPAIIRDSLEPFSTVSIPEEPVPQEPVV